MSGVKWPDAGTYAVQLSKRLLASRYYLSHLATERAAPTLEDSYRAKYRSQYARESREYIRWLVKEKEKELVEFLTYVDSEWAAGNDIGYYPKLRRLQIELEELRSMC